MAKHSDGKSVNKKQRRLDRREEKSLHIVEFSAGKPNEISFNVLEKMASAQDAQEKPGLFDRIFRRSKTQHGPSNPVIDSSVAASASSTVPSGVSAADLASGTASSAASGSAPGSASGAFGTSDGATASRGGAFGTPGGAASHGATPHTGPRKPFLGEDSRQEIKRRQTQRKRYRFVSIAIVVVVCVGLLAAGGYQAYTHYQTQTSNVAVLQQSCDLIEQSDTTIVAIDEFFKAEFGDDTVQRAQDLLAQIPDARQTLVSARALANQANQGLYSSTSDKEASEHALATIDARETLLDNAEKRLNEDIAAKQAMDAMNSAYDSIQQGNSLLGQAAREVSTGQESSADQINQSSEYTRESQTAFTQARDQLAQVSTLYPSADIKDEQAYVEARIEQTNYALASNEAMLIQDKSTAEQNNDSYNNLDKEAIALAETFAESFDQPVIDAYVANTQSLVDAYNQARNDMGTHDDYLRGYLHT